MEALCHRYGAAHRQQAHREVESEEPRVGTHEGGERVGERTLPDHARERHVRHASRRSVQVRYDLITRCDLTMRYDLMIRCDDRRVCAIEARYAAGGRAM